MTHCDIDAADLIHFANVWGQLGAAVTEQVEQVLDNPECGSCWEEGSEHGVNPNAIQMAADRLQGLNDQLDEALAEFLEQH